MYWQQADKPFHVVSDVTSVAHLQGPFLNDIVVHMTDGTILETREAESPMAGGGTYDYVCAGN